MVVSGGRILSEIKESSIKSQEYLEGEKFFFFSSVNITNKETAMNANGSATGERYMKQIVKICQVNIKRLWVKAEEKSSSRSTEAINPLSGFQANME